MRVEKYGGRKSWLAGSNITLIPGGVYVDPTKINENADGDLILKDGTIMGQLDNGDGCPMKVATLQEAVIAGATVLKVDNAELFQDGDPIKVGNEDVQIVSRDTSVTPHVINLVTGVVGAHESGEEVACRDGANGPKKAHWIADDYKDLKKQDKNVGGYIACPVFENRLPYPVAESIKNEIGNRIIFS